MNKLFLLLPMALLLSCGTTRSPNNLKYPALVYNPPSLVNHRFTLDNGIVAFIVEDNKLPVFDIHARVHCGGMNEEKKGLASLTGDLIEEGGLTSIPADSLDDLLEFYAITLSSDGDFTGSLVSASSVTERMDLTLDLFNRALREPAFEQKKLELLKQRYLESIHHRFDSPKGSLGILFSYAVYGINKKSELLSEKDIAQIGRDDIVRYYKANFRPENVILGVSGRFKTEDMLKKLNATIGTWPKSGVPETVFPKIVPDFKPAFHFVEKDINQSYVRIGLPLFKRPNPDYYPMVLMNFILGGAPFTSRISKKVREEEGLAYGTGTNVLTDYFYPGNFNAYLETKSSTTAYAITLVLEEFRKFIKSGATETELAEAKQSLIDAFPANFNTGDESVRAFTRNQYVKELDSLFDLYRGRVQAITLDQVRAVAEKYLKTDSMAICVVGKFTDCEQGDHVHPAKFSDLGTPEKLTESELNKRLGGE